MRIMDVGLTTWIALELGTAYLLYATLESFRTRGRPWRPTHGVDGDPPAGTPKGEAWFIEGKSHRGIPYSCSFVEFDERGDYLDFCQHQNAWKKIRELSADKKQKLLVVIYCHGWKNNSQSEDVVRFNRFLGRLANSQFVIERQLRVHGVFQSWRGNLYRSTVDPTSADYAQTKTDFGEPIVSDKYHRPLAWLLWPLELLSYWSRKRAAEAKVSGVPIARSALTYGNVAKHCHNESVVLTIGHSFGALMLEKSLGQACISALGASWPWWDAPKETAKPAKERLPFDCVLFVNSAAPSIHAKQLSDFLWADEAAVAAASGKKPIVPMVISVTSSADWATRYAHRIANCLAWAMPSLQRNYTRSLLQTIPAGQEHRPVRQSYFYERTPGHNPLLVGRWIVRAHDLRPEPVADSESVFDFNLRLALDESGEVVFYTSGANPGMIRRGINWIRRRAHDARPVAWKIVTDSVPPGWSQYKGEKPVKRGGYWIARCDHELIASHGDVWSEKTMELYAALYLLR